MKNVTKPRTVSFEDALRNLATKLTGTPVNMLPRTQEGVVQYMAEHVPSVDEMAEAITQEVIVRLAQADATGDGEPDEQEEPVLPKKKAKRQKNRPKTQTSKRKTKNCSNKPRSKSFLKKLWDSISQSALISTVSPQT